MKVNVRLTSHESFELKRDFLHDRSLWLLVFSNAVTIILALWQNWSLAPIMMIYWMQSVIIGIFNFIRILQLKDFSTEGFKLHGRSVSATTFIKIYTAFFFLFHYGLFHLIYLAFLMGLMATQSNGQGTIGWPYIYLTAGLFFINHLYSYIYNKPKDSGKQNIGSVMMSPYARIIPMHFTIFLSSIYGGAIIIFLLLKTIVDALMHAVEHKMIRAEKTIL